jgi:hypothetical protein
MQGLFDLDRYVACPAVHKLEPQRAPHTMLTDVHRLQHAPAAAAAGVLDGLRVFASRRLGMIDMGRAHWLGRDTDLLAGIGRRGNFDWLVRR